MNRRLITSLLAASTLAALPAAARADGAPPAPPATAGTTNERWEDVSHINGQLVKVGEKNEYLHRYRRTNISTNPLGWMLGFYGVSASYGLSSNVAIRADLNYMHPVGSNIDGFEVGFGVPIYLRRTYQGPFLEPGFIVRSFSSGSDSECDYCESSSSATTQAGPQVLVGWHWTWDSGLNVAAAVGAGRSWENQNSDYGNDGVFVNGYLRFGYAF